jgi:hypothetical protein
MVSVAQKLRKIEERGKAIAVCVSDNIAGKEVRNLRSPGDIFFALETNEGRTTQTFFFFEETREIKVKPCEECPGFELRLIQIFCILKIIAFGD